MAKKNYKLVFPPSNDGTCRLSAGGVDYTGKYCKIFSKPGEDIFLVARIDGASVICWIKEGVLHHHLCDKCLWQEGEVYYFYAHRWYWWESYDEPANRCSRQKAADLDAFFKEAHKPMYELRPLGKDGRVLPGQPAEGQRCELLIRGEKKFVGRYYPISINNGNIFYLRSEHEDEICVCWINGSQLWFHTCQRYIFRDGCLYLYCGDGWYWWETPERMVFCPK